MGWGQGGRGGAPGPARPATSTGPRDIAAASSWCSRLAQSGRRSAVPDPTGGPAMAPAAVPVTDAPPDTASPGRWIGQPVRRAQDSYLLTGRGPLLGDLC